jgi:hypothetical protein
VTDETQPPRQPTRSHLVGLSKLLFVAACATPAVEFGQGGGQPRGPKVGLYVLLIGWIVPLGGWVGNVFLFLGWLLRRRDPRTAAAVGLIGLAFGISYLVRPIVQPLVGAYLWAGSLGVFALGAVLGVVRRDGEPSPSAASGEPDAADPYGESS